MPPDYELFIVNLQIQFLIDMKLPCAILLHSFAWLFTCLVEFLQELFTAAKKS